MIVSMKIGSVVSIDLPDTWTQATSVPTVLGTTFVGGVLKLTAVTTGTSWISIGPRPEFTFRVLVNVV